MEQSLVSFKYHIALALDVNVYTCSINSTFDQAPGFEVREGNVFGHFCYENPFPEIRLFSARRLPTGI